MTRINKTLTSIISMILSLVLLAGCLFSMSSCDGGEHPLFRDEERHTPQETETIDSETETETEKETETETETENETETETNTEETELNLAPLPDEPDEDENAYKPMEFTVRHPGEDKREEPEELLESLRSLIADTKPDRRTFDDNENIIVVPAVVTYLYHNLVTGDTVSYGENEIRYAASLIKVPFIYSILREIETFEADPANRNEDGSLRYDGENKKYDLSEEWTYDPDTMYVEGSGEIMEQDPGFKLTWREIFEYSILYSDNIAVEQIRQRFGERSYYELVYAMGMTGTYDGYWDLSVHDCMLILREVYAWFAGGSGYAEMMKNAMINSRHYEIMCKHFPGVTVCHKYGWDIDAFHDMGIIYDEEPYILVIMTDYDEGDETALKYYEDVIALTKQIHSFYEKASIPSAESAE